MSDSYGFKIPRDRLLIFRFIIILPIAILLFYLFNLQVVKGLEYQKKAEDILKRDVPIIAQRGMIYDRNYDEPLVYNIDSFAVNVIPGDIPDEDKQRVFKSLSEILKIKENKITDKVKKIGYHQYRPVEIAQGISFKSVAYIAEHMDQFPGVTWISKPIRGYSEETASSLSHVIGYVDEITSEELNIYYNQGYNINSTIGKSGVEKQYDYFLKGIDGKRFKIVDVTEKSLLEKPDADIPPQPGKNLVLTINKDYQVLSEKALGERTGCVLVMRPTTGEILAMVSYPWFDPRIFYAENSSEKFAELSLNPLSPFLNRAVQSAYPPASVFKVIMSTAMLEENAFPIDATITCTGEMVVGDRTAHCWNKTGHGPLSFYDGLANSCNIYFFTIGSEYIGEETIIRYANSFGLGRLTGIDLPGEDPGFIPTPQWKLQHENMKWLKGDTMNLSIGQGWVTVNSIQIAEVISMIANEGKAYKPHVLKEVRDPITGEIIESIEPEELERPYISAQTFQHVKEGMSKVINVGTGRLVTTKAVQVVGKTGTSETGVEEVYKSWFASFAPYKTDNLDERVVVVVLIEDPMNQQWWASQTANIIYQGIFAQQNYEQAMKTLYPWMKFEEPKEQEEQ
ncbi:MAG: penicillin-binding protein 2 [Spirochaetales bacterium]|nr:penicillin-binding protein 2 [Spirochaetales bacterium]